MKNLILSTAIALTLSACAQSIAETAQINGESTSIQVRATPNNEWELLFDGQIVAKDSAKWTFDNTLHGSYGGQPVMARLYYRSNGWSAHKVADVFVDGQLIETLVIN